MSLDIDIEQRLKVIEQKIDHNSKILRGLKRKQTFDFWFGILKLVIFIASFYYAYQFIEPVLIQFQEVYSSFQDVNASIGSFKGFDFFKQTPQ